MTEIDEEVSEYNELKQGARRWYQPKGSIVQKTVEAEPVKALQIEEEQLVRLENAFMHPFKTMEDIVTLLNEQYKKLDLLYKDTVTRRQHHDEPAVLGATLNYELKYNNHTYVYCYSNTGFTLQVSNGATQVVPANYWTLVNYPRGVYFTVVGGSDIAPVTVMFRSCDVTLDPAISQSQAVATNINSINGVGDNAGFNVTTVGPWLYNGSTWDRQRANLDGITLVTQTTVGTGTYLSTDQTNYNSRGAKVYLNISAIGTGTVTVTIQGKDPVTNTYYTLLVGTAAAATGFTIMEVYPGTVAAANADANTVLPRTWRVSVGANMSVGTVSFTVSASVTL